MVRAISLLHFIASLSSLHFIDFLLLLLWPFVTLGRHFFRLSSKSSTQLNRHLEALSISPTFVKVVGIGRLFLRL